MKLDKKTIIILATDGLTTNMLYNKLEQYFEIKAIFIENKISKKIILKNRVKKIGWFKVLGQILFITIIMKPLQKLSSSKIKNILTINNVNSNSIPNQNIVKISSINSQIVIDKLKLIKPDLVFINGTRIISKNVLNSINAKFINIHVGITPMYRGVHGGYWALYNNEPNLFGTTLHYVDSGIDTGNIITQGTMQISKSDNFATYPIIQFILGLKLLENSIDQIKSNTVGKVNFLTTKSELYYHPTIIQYLIKRLTKGIK
jgi:methionyl-tRNA formyltransferase